METTPSQQPNLAVRIVGAVVLAVLILAFMALYIFPENTDLYFAWTIKPATTAILIGEGYLAGGLFFLRVITGKKWQHFQAGFLPITAFTICMLAATLLHWNRFHQGTFLFYFWTVIYAVTPLLVPFLWWRNRSRDGHTLEDNDLFFDRRVRLALGGVGAAGLVTSLAMFIFPALLISITPWTLTELTGRIYAGWGVLAFCTMLSIARDGRWSATRVLLQSFIFGQVLTLPALPRIWNDLDPAKPMTFVFLGGLAVAMIGCILLYGWVDRKSRRKASHFAPLQAGK